MIKRMLVAMVASMASPVLAQAISGTLSANFVSFNEFGQPTTHVALNLACSLSCPTSAPQLTFGAGFGDGFFVAEPMQKCGSLSTGFSDAVRTTGTSATDTTNFPAGANFFVKVPSVTCQCGNRTGEGGFIDLQSATVSIPPWINLVTPPAPVVAGEFYLLTVTAAPRVGETVDVTVRGAGADYAASLPSTDFVSTNTTPTAVPKRIDVPFTQAGTVTVTAKVTGGPMATKTFEVIAGSASGGGSGSTGGGAGSTGGGGGRAPAGGCTAVPMLLPLAMVLLALRRRRN